MSERIYVLQKDLPDSKAGDEYHLDERDNVYYKNGNNTDSWWKPSCVEFDDGTWFKPKEEKIKVMELYPHDIFERGVDFKKFCYVLATSKKVPQEKYEKVKKTIEAVLNYEKVMIVPFVKDSGWRIDMDVLSDQPPIKTYTEKEVLDKEEKAFWAGRYVSPISMKNFSDYKNQSK